MLWKDSTAQWNKFISSGNDGWYLRKWNEGVGSLVPREIDSNLYAATSFLDSFRNHFNAFSRAFDVNALQDMIIVLLY